jgi:hypothetical protein
LFGAHAWFAALCSSSVCNASQSAENGSFDLLGVDFDLHGLVFLRIEYAEMPAETDECGLLVIELEFHPLRRARILALDL